ncbi:hypothetical protein [Tumebacillus lipolyticus]|uniref:DUF4825 domain-containing protein n=1 Tax=Tumebacillus lipolyticus TaxID=1280370 RepID=A0ABW5A029_9BACL
MKKRALTATVAVLLIGGITIFTLMKEDPYANIEIATSSAMFEKFHNIDELEKGSELVVIGNFTGERELFHRPDNYGGPGITLSKSTVNIEKVLKGEAKEKETIPVFEESYIKNDYYVNTADYKWMNKDGRYLLFLEWNTRKDTYIIVGIYQGKYDLKLTKKIKQHESSKKAFLDSEVEFLGRDHELEHFYKLKEEALKKYKL